MKDLREEIEEIIHLPIMSGSVSHEVLMQIADKATERMLQLADQIRAEAYKEAIDAGKTHGDEVYDMRLTIRFMEAFLKSVSSKEEDETGNKT